MPKWIVPSEIDMKEVIADVDIILQSVLADPIETGYAIFIAFWDPSNFPLWDDIGPKTEGDQRVLEHSTDSTPFIWVDQGTKGPYPIKAKNAPMLSFKTGGFPKTKPGQLMSSAGAPGTQQQFAKEIMHPGIKARDATGEVVMRCDDVFDVRMQNQINAAKTY